jgi:uncharacterized protein (TIGR03086 family)
MDATQALAQTNSIVNTVIGGLSSDDRETSSPCSEWNVHEVLEHMCQGGQMIAGGLQGQAPPDEMPDFLANGPAEGWSNAYAALADAATPEALTASHQMPFGEVPGEIAVSVITAEHLVHARDVAEATGQSIEVDDELAQWALDTWKVVVPAEGRDGGGFADVVPVADDASLLDQLLGYTGRQP